MKKYYEILGVDKNSSSKDIKKAYRSLSMKYHPDHNSDSNATEKMAEINEAYETLSDDNKKQEYDNQTNSPFKSKTGPPTSPGPNAKEERIILVGKSVRPKSDSRLCISPRVGPISNSSAHVSPSKKEPT